MMSEINRLSAQEWTDIQGYLPAREGEQTKMDCPFCSDAKQRGGIKHAGDCYLYNCFNCGVNGKHRITYNDYYATKDSSRDDGVSSRDRGGVEEARASLSSYLSKCRGIDISARSWLYKYGISDDEIRRYSLVQDSRSKRIVMPIYRSGVLVGAQARRTGLHGPKYITHRVGADPLWTRLESLTEAPKSIVLTEDYLSAIKVSRVADATCLFGVNLVDGAALDLVMQCPRIVHVWLDDDNPDVRKKQREIHARVSTLGLTCSIVRGLGDPKHHSTDKIKQVIYERTGRLPGLLEQ